MKDKSGFTLIELLVVIAIIGLLSTLAVVSFSSSKVKARDVARMSDVKSIQSAVEVYKNNSNAEAAPSPLAWSDLVTDLASYFPSGLPSDPGTGVYVYCSGSKGGVIDKQANFLIGANLEGTADLSGGLNGTASTDTYGATVQGACVASNGSVVAAPRCDPTSGATGDVTGGGLGVVSFCLGSL